MSLTVREAVEQVRGVQVAKDLFGDSSPAESLQKLVPLLRALLKLPQEPARGYAEDDEDAKSVADDPHLTGDPEFDAVELAETDPTRKLRRVK